MFSSYVSRIVFSIYSRFRGKLRVQMPNVDLALRPQRPRRRSLSEIRTTRLRENGEGRMEKAKGKPNTEHRISNRQWTHRTRLFRSCFACRAVAHSEGGSFLRHPSLLREPDYFCWLISWVFT